MLILALALTACAPNGEVTSPKAQGSPEPASAEPAEAPPPAEEVPEKPKGPELDETPSINFISNWRRLHLYDTHGLVIPFITAGVQKYSEGYRRPFGDVAEFDGVRARKLTRNATDLIVPWHSDGAATVVLWTWGKKGQRVELKANGKRVGVKPLTAGWNEVVFAVEQGRLKPGVNELLLFSRAPVHSMRVVEGAFEANGQRPNVEVLSKQLQSFDGYALYQEIPNDAFFVGETSNEGGSFVVSTAPGNDKTFEVTDAPIDLSAYAGKVVRLELQGQNLTWLKASIQTKKRDKAPEPKQFKNAILLVVDALRSDRLTLYNSETRVATPRFTELARKQGLVFLNNQAASPSSPPSHGSIQTGMIARVHGVAGDKGQVKPGIPLLSSQLEDAGIKTAYVGNNAFGMRRLRKPGRWSKFVQPVSEGMGIDCSAIVTQTLKFARETAESDNRFFVSMLPFEPHTPYRFHEGISEKYHDGDWGKPVGKSVSGYLLNDIAAGRKVLNEDQWSQLKGLYDGEVEHMDACFGDLVDGLNESGLLDDTVIVLTSDHGEAMFERGKMGHAYGLYSELTNVPFVIFGQGIQPAKVEVPTSVLDIVPTILDLVNVEASPKVQGQSVVEMGRRGSWTPQVVSSEYGRMYSLRSKDWRLIVNYDGTRELYHQPSDPTEQTNRIEDHTYAAQYLRETTGFFVEYRSDWHAPTWGYWSNHLPGFNTK